MGDRFDEFRLQRSMFITSLYDDIRLHYDIKEELGRGSYGCVVKATEYSTGLTRAVKIIPKTSVSIRFRGEVDILRKLDHPNIVKIINTFDNEFAYYIVFECCEGGELYHRIIKRKQMSEPEATHFIRQALLGIHYCHLNGVTHCDLKPQNLLLADSQTDDLKIADFGLSQELAASRRLTALAGTLHYAAPEMLNACYGPQVDMWALGVIMYIMLSGRVPFFGSQAEAVAEAITTQAVSFNYPQFSYISATAKDFILRLLDKDPVTRMTAGEALEHDWITCGDIRSSMPFYMEFHDALEEYVRSVMLKKAALMYIATRLSHVELNTLNEIFIQMDINHDGVLSKLELEQGARRMGKTLNEDELSALFSSADANCDGKISYSEFLSACQFYHKYVHSSWVESAFSFFDSKKTGRIRADSLKKALKNRIEDCVAEQVIEEADRSGSIDYQSFFNLMTL